MESLFTIIKNLKKEEIRNFKVFTNRFNRADEIKIATLFDLIRTSKEDDEKPLVKKIFPHDPDNFNAFYRLKNRLKTELEKSLLNLHHNLDEKTTINNLITLSSIFNYKAQYELSFHYLKKAEKLAEQNEFFDLLDFVYNELINLSYNYNDINPLEYIEKKRENTQRSLMMMQANHDIAAIRYRLMKTNYNKMSEDIQSTLERIVSELNVAKEIYDLPNVRLKIHFCVRNILLQNKDFKSLEAYMIDSLKQFEEGGFFNKNTHRIKITILTWIVNTLTINRKWDEALQYTQMLYDELQKYNKLHYDTFIWTYYQSLITNYMSSGKIKEAMELLDQIREMPNHKNNPVYEFAIYVNLSLCHYFLGQYSTAIKTLSHLLTRDVYPKLSSEMQYSLAMVESIIHYDNDNHDYVGYRLTELRRQFRSLLKTQAFQEEKTFQKILLALVNKPAPFKNKAVVQSIENFVKSSSGLQVGSSKHIDYGIWLSAKLHKKPYYDSLMDSLKNQN
jgi:tetratricopeptide (TPR) repeat protein